MKTEPENLIRVGVCVLAMLVLTVGAAPADESGTDPTVAEQLLTDELSDEALAAEEAAAEQLAAEEAAAEELAAEEAAAEEAAAEEAAAEELAAEELAAEELAAEELAAEELAAEELAAEELAAEELAAEELAAEEEATAEQLAAEEAAAAEETVAEEAAAEEVAAEEAAAEELAAEEAAAAEQLAEEEAAAKELAVEEAAVEEAAVEEAAVEEAAVEEAAVEEAAAAQQLAVEKAAKSGEDVVAEVKTSPEELAEIEASKKAAAEAVATVEQQTPVTIDEDVVTTDTSRSSDEEAGAVAASTQDSGGSDVWKYLGAAAAGALVGALIPEMGGRVVQNHGDRVIVEREGEYYVRNDENLLLRRPGVNVQTEQFADGITRTYVDRNDGSRIVTIRDAGGFVLKRTRILPDGTELVLIDESRYGSQPRTSNEFEQILPPQWQPAPDAYYVVDYSQANPDALRQTLVAPPVFDFGSGFTVREVRENESVRALMPRVDLDAIHFAPGSAAVQRAEAQALTSIGRAMARVVAENPNELFLIEGHTDATGSNLMNLALSDRRAEAVAIALTEYFDIPPENLLVQGYGEQYLKLDTQAANQANRRATVRRITPLLDNYSG